MNGLAVVSLTLASALVVAPSSPQRWQVVRPHRRQDPLPARWVLWVGGGVLVGAVVVLPLTTVLVVAVVGATATLRYRRHRRGRRGAREAKSLEAALDVLVGELRVGIHPVRAFGTAADETEGAVAASMRAVAARARLGADVTGGLRAAARMSALPTHWERLAVYWQLASDHGLAIATLMRAARRDIVERQRFSESVASELAGARATANILSVLPLLGVLLGQLIGARPVSFMLNGHAGGWLLVVGVGLVCAGLLWSDRITDRVAP
ncbi:type II secretion system F family protein [Mycobacterium ostraviense]|uniref:Type II secretion system protein GspF domain-containing protein n=1 Tax=Mycobacterium ostraviense TaxID=2738409 RepID=A0A164ASR3_9MYCO|nr:type II secretion system F family protein [Mycobacterium ostraviense]KZS62774.1 hypothetical protein A4G28_11660 [Mycobacterium ostraviense]UGT91771.1 type II secretion system F family protein [Mycobacterium ostraviense]